MSYFLKIPEDNKYEEKMQRKKLVLADRGRKIFDPILSQQAYNTAEIEQQITERKNMERAERIRDAIFDRAACRLDTVHQMIDQRQQEATKSRAQELDTYRTVFQGKERSATFDLNDPEARKKTRPIAHDGDYSTYGPSSILTFESDKIRQPRDLKDSMLKLRDGLGTQMDEQQAKRDAQRHLDNVAHGEKAAQSAKLNDLELVSQALQKAMKMANHGYNEALATLQQDTRRRTAELEEKDRQAHVNNTINSNLLNEIPNNKRDKKRLTPDEQAEIYDCWGRQKHEIADARNQQRQEECTWSNYFRGVGNEYSGQMKALQEKRTAMRRETDRVNQKQACESQEREDFNRVVYGRADPTEEFFGQFQRDPR